MLYLHSSKQPLKPIAVAKKINCLIPLKPLGFLLQYSWFPLKWCCSFVEQQCEMPEIQLETQWLQNNILVDN